MASMTYEEYLFNKQQELLKQKDELLYDKSKKEFELSQIEKKIFVIEKKLVKIELEKIAYRSFKREEFITYLKNLSLVASAGLLVDVPAHVVGERLISSNTIKGLDILAALMVLTGTGYLTFDLCSEIKDFKKQQFIRTDKKTITELNIEKLNLLKKSSKLEEEIQDIRSRYCQVMANLDQNHDDIKAYELCGDINNKTKIKKNNQ